MERKLAVVRAAAGGKTVRLRGIDWFAWATAGSSSVVLLAAETGVAEVLVTGEGAWVLTDDIEAPRLREEELPEGFSVHISSWADPDKRETFVREVASGGEIVSDRPLCYEKPLQDELVAAKRVMSAEELTRYREVGMHAADAMSETLRKAEPEWTERQLAGTAAAALLQRGLDPALAMAAGERRLHLYRHPVSKGDRLGAMAMLVFCARGHGLYANLTRFVSFGPLSPQLAERHASVREVEARVLAASRPGVDLGTLYGVLAEAYASCGYRDEIGRHHQGGTTGYLSREVVARPWSPEVLAAGSVVAWNPSVPGAKVEDTFVVGEDGLENLTADPSWPAVAVDGIPRPLVLER